jgi:hypothetical protein
MALIREIVQQALNTDYLTLEAEEQLRLLLNALLSVSENHAQSKSLRAFPHNDLSGEFLIETQKCRSIGKTHALSGLQRMRSPRVTEER